MAKQDWRQIRDWQSAHGERLEIKPRKELHLSARIAAAVEAGRAASRQEYIIRAITDALERDGIPEAQHLDDDKTPEA